MARLYPTVKGRDSFGTSHRELNLKSIVRMVDSLLRNYKGSRGKRRWDFAAFNVFQALKFPVSDTFTV